MKQRKHSVRKRCLALMTAILLAVSMLPTMAFAENADSSEEGYQVTVTATAADASVDLDDLRAGDSVILTAEVTYNGETVTDLSQAGLYLWWWTNVWNDYSDCSDDVTYSDYDGGSGLSLSATVTFGSAGSYCIAAELQDSSYTDVTDCLYLTYEVGEAETAVTPEDLENTDFETGDTTGWSVSPELSVVTDEYASDPDNHYLNLWVSDTEESDVTISYTVENLAAGTYQVQVDLEGMDSDTGLSLYVTDAEGNLLTEKTDITTIGWDDWQTFSTDEFTLDEAAAIIIYIAGTTPAGYWGGLDNLVLCETDDVEAVAAGIEVERVDTLTEDFIMGMDISTIVSEYASGVEYYDFDGNQLETVTDFCQFLADECGVTSVRVRVWNDPYDEDGNSYGAGNCDVENAVTIAEACYEAGLDMLVDFHYSDFWADPNRQLTPKAWTDYTTAEKAEALYAFTYESLNTIAATGVTISMVQVGNETSNAIAGVSYSDMEGMCTLFSSGSAAVRRFSEETYDDASQVLVAIHVANPNNQEMTWWAGNLQDYDVDYDVLATSYYAFWHGTYENLKSQMQTVMDTYGKQVLVAETSYVYTAEDTDGQGNSVVGDTDLGSDEVYEASVQGQANALRDVINAVSEVGGLGVYYWEPAWITVGDITGLEGDALEAQIAANSLIWETYGSGWASSYAYSYDPYSEDYGGSEWDNQALFDASGHPLESLNVYNYVQTGSYTDTLYVSSVQNPELTYIMSDDATLEMPDTVNVVYSKSSVGTVAESVVWDADEVAAVDLSRAVTYEISGTATLSQECTDGTTTVDVICYVIVKEANLITDSDVAGFETAEGFTCGTGITLPSTENVLEGSYAAHWWNSADEAVTSTISYTWGILEAGYYTLELKGMGADGDGVTLLILDADGNTIATGDTTILTGWYADAAYWSDASVTFCLEEDTEITFVIQLDMQGGGWGSVDSLYLHQHASLAYADNEDGTHAVSCADCEAALADAENCDYELTSVTAATCTEDGASVYTCTGCGDTYTEVIAATGHTVVIDEAVAATETSTGLTEGSHCSVCGEVLVAQEVIPAIESAEIYTISRTRWMIQLPLPMQRCLTEKLRMRFWSANGKAILPVLRL
ncbi:MAG: glycosyl hydrolase 53 family protein [Clostridiales bacterium]|nr:glycosyl hydrolase 53 family protein [Clostridiales bacterium]